MFGFAKRVGKRLAFQSGAFALFQRYARSDTLTVLMFHRVLPETDPRFLGAHPTFTMRLDVFEACLEFLGSHYAFVSLGQVRDAYDRKRQLPPNALLLTFDDGWEDTARYAAPTLAAQGIPAAVFVTTGAMGSSTIPWRDVATSVWRIRTCSPVHSGDPELRSLPDLLTVLGEMDPMQRNAWLLNEVSQAGSRILPLMMSIDDLRTLPATGLEVGGHGVTHASMTDVADVDSEISPCYSLLTQTLGEAPYAFSFPNGRYTQAIAGKVISQGFRIVFTSDGCINKLEDGYPTSPQFGRVCPSEDDIVGPDRKLAPERFAQLLMSHPVDTPIGMRVQ